ncbi:4285_t:CDS:2 [Diversispora eburnea]|uniref:4285_t:CDS:1 n=1 Tax=Diversispora eburnea TaxID=1213867 RepID=A0A9N9BAD7_9GLOM|nr:4285_t:CDS:2 [Diversispora eburnea]
MNQTTESTGNSKDLAVAVNNKTNAALNYFISKAPNLIPSIVNTAKLITPKISKGYKENEKHESQDNYIYTPPPTPGNIIPSKSSTLLPTYSRRRVSKSLNEVDISSRSDHQRRPSEPPRIDKRSLQNEYLENSVYTNVPAINVHHVDNNNFNNLGKTSMKRSLSISNVPIIKEGYLNKRIDFDAKSLSTSRGWKVYRVILKGSKLYFYRPPSEAVLKTFFPNNKDLNMSKEMGSTLSPVIATDRGMNLNPANFDPGAIKLIWEGITTNTELGITQPLISKYYYGEICYEVDRSMAMRFKKSVCLLIFEDNVIICKRKWVRYTSANLRPIMDAMGFGGGGGNYSSNVTSPNSNIDLNGQDDRDTKSINSIRGTQDNDNSNNTNKGKGYYTKWKLDTCYSIHSIDVIPDPNLPTGYSPYIAPSSQPSFFTANKHTDDNSSLRSGSSSVSVIANVSSSSGAILYLNIIDGRNKDSYRVFVAPNNDTRLLWISKLWGAKKSSLKKMMKISIKEPLTTKGLNGESDFHGSTNDQNGFRSVGFNGYNDTSGIIGSGEKSAGATTPTRKIRAYWGTGRHPELIIKESNIIDNSTIENLEKNPEDSVENSVSNIANTLPITPTTPTTPSSFISQTSHPSHLNENLSQRFIRGGSVDSLIHELLFETQKGNNQNNDDFLHTFLLTFPLFSEINHIFRELKRCTSMHSSIDDDNKPNKIVKRSIFIIEIWCQNCGHDLLREDVWNGMQEIINDIISKESLTDAEYLNKLMHETRNKLTVENDNELTLISPTQSAPSLDLSNLLVTGLTPALFLKMVPEELAQQLYLYHFLELKKSNPRHNLRSFIPSKNRNDTLTNECPLNSTPTSPHFLTRLIYHHILIAAQQSAYTSRRPVLLTHWIQTGIACKSLGDMVGWMAVASAVCSPGIIRLKETWKRVDEQWRNVVINDWVPLLSSYGGLDGDSDLDNMNPLLLIVYDKKEKNKIKSIPYFGFITLAMESLNLNIPSVIDRNTGETNRVGSRNNSISGMGIINFEKYRRMYDTIISSLNQWDPSEEYKTFDISECPFTQLIPLQKYFHHLNSIPSSSTLDPWQLFDSSLMCEPRLHGQYLEHHARQRKSPSVYVPLVFTEVIPSNRLFEKQAFLNASGTLGKKLSNSSLNDNNAYTSMASPTRTTFPGQTLLNSDMSPTKLNSPSINSPDQQENVRKRTLSFPPARIGPLTSTTWNTGLDLVTRNWLGSLVQHRGSYNVLLKCMKDIAGVGEMLKFVKDGELVFKSVRDATNSRPSSIVEASSGTTSKRNSLHGMSHSPRTSLHVNIEHDALMVVVKAGTLERLIDVLVNGVTAYSASVVDDNGEPPLSIGRQSQLGINSTEYTATFFSTYRSFCSPNLLLDILRKRFMNAKKVSKEPKSPVESNIPSPDYSEKDSDENENYDWNKVTLIQSRILSVFRYWIEEFFHDFLDDLTLRNHLLHFLNEAKSGIESRTSKVSDEHLSNEFKELKDSVRYIKQLATTKSLEPAYDIQNEKMAHLVDKIMNSPSSLSNKGTSKNEVIPSPDAHDSSALLDSIDLAVLELFETVTPQDWILAFEVLETQSADVLGWYPKKQIGYISEDEILITDIFTTLQSTERTGNSKESVLNSLPRSIQALCRIHNTIRKWVIQEVSSPNIEIEPRVKRMNIFLDMILLSRKRMVKLDIYPKGEAAKNESEAKRSVPSFVESAIVSALISPESRLFTRAWSEVAISRNGSMESLDSLLQNDLIKTHIVNSTNPNLAMVPCIGWLFERMSEICCNVPDMSFESEKLINYDKRRYVYNLTQIFVRLQRELTEKAQDRKPTVDVHYMISPNSRSGSKKNDWRKYKEVSSRENNALKVTSVPPRQTRSLKPFSKFVTEQQEKIKRDQKERERLTKEFRDSQNRLQKKQNEQAKLLEKQSRTQQRPRNKSRVESFIKHAVRPISMAFASTWHHSGNSNSTRNNISSKPQVPNSKPALVINLINSQTSVDYSVSLDFVFRIVSEEGAQYLFQAMDYDDMNDWMRFITEVSKEGAEKRMTIFKTENQQIIDPKEEEVIEETKTRNSVYGKDLFTLMADGRIPILVEKCIAEIEKRGLEEVGIYRVSGSAVAINKLRAAFNKNAEAVDLSDEEYRDINIVAGALKLFFRSLPEPITTYEYYDQFIQASDIQDRDGKFYAIKDLLYKLPKPNYDLLKRLIEHLERVTDYEEFNHMYAGNLAIVFGPNLLKSRDFAVSMGNLGHHTSIIKCLILSYHWFFNTEEEEASDIEYLDPDIELSEPENEGLQTNNPLTDDASSFDNRSAISESDAPSEPNFDDRADGAVNLEGEMGKILPEEPDNNIFEGNLEENSGTDNNFKHLPLIQVQEESFINDDNKRESALTDVIEESEDEQSELIKDGHHTKTEINLNPEHNTQVQESHIYDTQVQESIYDTQVQESQIYDTQVQESQIYDTQVQESLIYDIQVQESQLYDTQVQESIYDTQVQESQIYDTQVQESRIYDDSTKEDNENKNESNLSDVSEDSRAESNSP